ncbi:haloacid dehalogenase-like hydrolase family protein [Theileria parva strain Muguga]|uniref:Haloacid dehalogenase-like family hydrolase n=1 Tax=Theileria parva TaxID=5875 RepID=Q4N6U4_THEPA|nr:haloacid dehalogenase-like hydrolase family protein [Theileria parva strain Muguga]EAN34314.1 haloacid dehalogenase-like hydrolase family protein [Theileria parva strain Muguga]|eukprot:XP_766597.1 hypothetical protein [Theileria parva strain Muguga]
MTILSIVIFLLINVSSDPISDFVKPATPPKYFAIDIDGTFHIKDESKFKKNVEAFKRLKQNNITPFFCTGRDTFCVKKLLGDSFFNESGYNFYPGVYANGTLVYDSDGNLISELKFEDTLLEKFIQYFEDNGLKDKTMYLTKDGFLSLEEFFDDGKKAMNLKQFVLPEKVTKGELKQKDVVAIAVFKIGLTNCNFIDQVYPIEFSKHGYTQITPSECNKKIGLEKLLKKLQSSGQECAFIGDDSNDLEPMEFCSISFAVGDAVDEAKNKAKWLLDLKHDECAFEKVVELLVN